MDTTYVTPFMKSVENIFLNTLHVSLRCHTPVLLTRMETKYDVSGIISFSGEVTGLSVISLGEETASKLVTLYAGMEIKPGDADFADALGELLNVIAGHAKSQFAKKQVILGCPSVVLGKRHQILRPKDAPVIEIPCESDCGPFALEVTVVDPSKTLQCAGTAGAPLSS